MGNDRWEYCVVRTKNVIFFTTMGERKEGACSDAAAIASLGLQGWEMVGGDSYGLIIYFKRRLQ